MSGNNNSIPDANIPMAWALNDSGIPIAVAVDPTPQNIQITELEHANAQMAERAQAQERALQEEKIKQQKQQQELQKAQQQLIQVQKEQEIESQFNLTQMRLIDEYTNRISLAAEYRQLGNFDKAIQQYEMSISSIKKLDDAYKNKEYSKGGWFVSTPSNYSNYIQQASLEIVNCLMYKGAFEQAYDTLHDLRTNTNSHILDTKIKECRDIIYQHARKLISEVKNMHTRGNDQQLAIAQNLLTTAEKLLTKIGQAHDSHFVLQAVRLEWDSIRDRINKECHSLLTSTFELAHYETAAQRAGAVVTTYKEYAGLLDSQELAYFTEIVNLLPSLEQVALQLRINSQTKDVEKYLSIGDIPAAYLTMHEIYNLAVQIKNPQYIEQKGLIYQHPHSYYLRLQNLELEVQQFKLRAKQQHNVIVEKIIEAALKKLGERTKNASLFENDLKSLTYALNIIIQQQWHKFDRRPEPRELINNMGEHIAAGCSDIGFFKKWFYWSYATSCLNDPAKTLAAAKQQLNEYVPTTQPDVVIKLDNAIRIRPR